MIYLRKIDNQCINKQISYTQEIKKIFLDGVENHDVIHCEGQTSHYKQDVKILMATDPRFDNGIKTVLNAEGQLEEGDIMMMSKYPNKKYIVELIKMGDERYAHFLSLFINGDRHLLCLSDDQLEKKPHYSSFKYLLAWFQKQLRINNDLAEGNKVKGEGGKDSSLRELYSNWRIYDYFSLDCNLLYGYLGTSNRVNYIQKTETELCIRPNFKAGTKEIESFFIDIKDEEKYVLDDIEIQNILEKKYNILNLDLSNQNEPNDNLKELFDDYIKVINYYSLRDNYDNCKDRLRSGINVILYGVPGAGKSYTVEHNYVKDKECVERVVFHPDYTYSDFIGQILPHSFDGNISYEFTPGPFTKILRESYRNPLKNYVLIIEEINRGNAPAIFGDVFQLLDRDKRAKIKDAEGRDIDNPFYCENTYGITNADIAKVVYNDEKHKVKLPTNLSIICTMNTSDQNVFNLDTAFQRRWEMRLVENVFNKESLAEKAFAEHKILDTNITWEIFCNTINDLILEKNQNMSSAEDKRLGTHFINVEDLNYNSDEDNLSLDEEQKKFAKLHNNMFAEKVIKYLWDDAFKFNRDEVFVEEYNSLEKVLRIFSENRGDSRFNFFENVVKDRFFPSQNRQ